jgi:muramidase (phage lysozyme)
MTTNNKPINIQAFLDLIAYSEGTSTSSITINNGYDVIVTGIHGQSVFTDYSKHPNVLVEVRSDPPLYSTAAGRYQLLYRYWVYYCKILHLSGYTPDVQDAIAIRQITERDAYDDVIAGDFEIAISKCSGIWASFPGNDYMQHKNSMNALLEWIKNRQKDLTIG